MMTRDFAADSAHLLDSAEAIAKRIEIFKTVERLDADNWSCPEWFDPEWNNWTIFPEDQRALSLDNCAGGRHGADQSEGHRPRC